MVSERGIDTHRGGRKASLRNAFLINLLLCILLAIPRASLSKVQFELRDLNFFVAHQVTFWLLLALNVWLFTGQSRIVAAMLLALIIVFWTPAVVILVERNASTDRGGRTVSERMLRKIDKSNYLDTVYTKLFIEFGYGGKDMPRD